VKVIYSIGSKLAGGGIGNVAYHEVEGIYRNGFLKKVITLDRAKERIDPEILKLHHNVHFPLYRISWMFPRRRFYLWEKYSFSMITRKRYLRWEKMQGSG